MKLYHLAVYMESSMRQQPLTSRRHHWFPRHYYMRNFFNLIG